MQRPLAQIRSLESVVRNHVNNTYRKSARSIANGCEDPAYPKRFRVANVTRRWALENVSELRDWDAQMRGYAASHGLSVEEQQMCLPAKVRFVTHVTVPSASVASDMLRANWPDDAARTGTLARRLVRIRDTFGPDALDRVCEIGVHRVDNEDECDFDLTVEAAAYMSTHNVDGLTPRQVPLAGFSAKWLNATRLSVIQAMVGREIKLAERPAQIDFAYLDPDHAASGHRHFDSHVIGDASAPEYMPEHVIIVENVDNMLNYPQSVPLGICVFGRGYAAAQTLPCVGWIRDCPDVSYWGDIDEDGFKILNAIRENGIDARSIHMDADTYKRYARYGTCRDKSSRIMAKRPAKECEQTIDRMGHLDEDEKATLMRCMRTGSVRRIEQERIPF